MSKVESGFVPLPKVEREQPSEHLEIRLGLPSFVDQDRIGVNVSRIDSLSRLGGIRRLAVFGTYGDETSNAVPNIVGFNPDGSAMASKSTAKVAAPTFDTKSTSVDDFGRQKRIDVGVEINIDEISQRHSVAGGAARSPEPYIKETDKAIRLGIRNAGMDNLVWAVQPISVDVLCDVVNNVTILLAINNIAEQKWIGFSFNVLAVGLFTLTKVLRWEMPNGRLSYFQGPQYDRAFLLQLKTRTQKLVADLHSSKK